MTKEGSGSPDLRQDLHEDYDELGVICPPHTTEKKLMTRIDLHLLPFISLLYLLAFLDRVNIANAKSFGLTEDLKLGGTEYNTILTIFFVPCKFVVRPVTLRLVRRQRGATPVCDIDINRARSTLMGHLLITRNTRHLSRDPLQHPPQEILPEDMAIPLRHRLRPRHALPRPDAELRRNPRNQILPGLL